MTKVSVTRSIDAPPAVVFQAVSDIASLPDTVEEVVGIEFLTENHSGVGTRFRETRMMQGKEMITELEVTEYEQDRRVRMVADSHGTIWDTLFLVEERPGGATLIVTMDARAHRWLSRIMNPIMKGLFRRGMEKHFDAVKAWCESRA